MHWTCSGGRVAAGEGDEPGKATAEKRAARRCHNPRDLCRGLCSRSGAHPLRWGNLLYTALVQPETTPGWINSTLAPFRHTCLRSAHEEAGAAAEIGRSQHNEGVSPPTLLGYTESLPRKAAEQIYTRLLCGPCGQSGCRAHRPHKSHLDKRCPLKNPYKGSSGAFCSQGTAPEPPEMGTEPSRLGLSC